MGRRSLDLHTRIKRAIVNAGDEWIKRIGDGVTCTLCSQDLNFTDKTLNSRIREHVSKLLHQDNILKSKGINPDEISSNDESQIPKMSPKQYVARSREEIDCALAFIAAVESSDGVRVGSVPTDGTSNDGNGIPEQDSVLIDGAGDDPPLGPTRPRTLDRTWNYFRVTDRVSVSGNELWECVFCNFEGTKNIASFKRHLARLCPGVPLSIKRRIKREAKAKGQTLARLRNKGYSYMYDDSGSDIDEGNKALQILTKLLSDKSTDFKDTTDSDNCMEQMDPLRKRSRVEENRDSSRDSSRDDHLDREIKELQIKKMKAEIRRINQETANEELTRAEILVRIEEGKERRKFFNFLNLAIPAFFKHNTNTPSLACQLVHCVLGNDLSTNEPTNSNSASSNTPQSKETPNLLQEAFAETINHAD